MWAPRNRVSIGGTYGHHLTNTIEQAEGFCLLLYISRVCFGTISEITIEQSMVGSYMRAISTITVVACSDLYSLVVHCQHFISFRTFCISRDIISSWSRRQFLVNACY